MAKARCGCPNTPTPTTPPPPAPTGCPAPPRRRRRDWSGAATRPARWARPTNCWRVRGNCKARSLLDRAYEPLRLEGALPIDQAALDRVWQLWTPNKVLGLPGIRAAYAIAPVGAQASGATDAAARRVVAAGHPRHRDAGVVDDGRNPGLGERQPEHPAPVEGAADRVVHVSGLRVPAQPGQLLHRAAARPRRSGGFAETHRPHPRHQRQAARRDLVRPARPCAAQRAAARAQAALRDAWWGSA